MPAVTAGMVKDLRELTGSGMMDCKRALAETDGDMDKAVEYLREKGLAAAEKKASRIAAEGICDIAISADGRKAAIIEVNSETDFVAKNEKFREYVGAVAAQSLSTGAADIEAFLEEPWSLDASKKVKEELSSQIAVIGEKLSIRRFAVLSAGNGFVETYIHMGGRIGVLVEFESTVDTPEVHEAAKNVAMQIAAMNPHYVKREEVPADFLAHETEIIKALVDNEEKENAAKTGKSKPEQVIEKMVEGKLNKELKEMCLVDQLYVKDSDLTVGAYISKVAKDTGSELSVVRFVRYETGEGLEKKSENFAEEVAKQMGQ